MSNLEDAPIKDLWAAVNRAKKKRDDSGLLGMFDVDAVHHFFAGISYDPLLNMSDCSIAGSNVYEGVIESSHKSSKTTFSVIKLQPYQVEPWSKENSFWS